MSVPVPQAFALALEHHQAGRLAEAEARYRQILAIQPNHAEALHHLGVIALQRGRCDLAVEWIRRAIVLDPNNPAAHANLGEACRRMSLLNESIASFRRAQQLKPDEPEISNSLGLALAEHGQLTEAVAAYRRALELKPAYPEACGNLGNALCHLDQLDEAVNAYRRALKIKPIYPEACNDLGVALTKLGQLDEAVAVLRRALEQNPDMAEICNNLGAAQKERGQLDEAVANYRRAIQLKPAFPDAHVNLAGALSQQGQVDEAIAAYRRAIDLRPGDAALLSNLILMMQLSPTCEARAIEEMQARWNRLFVEPLRASWRAHGNDHDPGRRLKISYVSPDFRSHAVSFFLAPLFEAHDHTCCEIYCYSDVRRPDAVTERLRKSADVWRDVRPFSDAQLTECVRDDGIDILVDLAMHSQHNRLLVFARQPAPVQVSWLAYPGSTGMEKIGYRLTDAYLDPAGRVEAGGGEKAVRLPDAWCCYHPLTEQPPINALPAAETGRIVFGCFNNFYKINAPSVALFASVLRTVEGSRLILLAPAGSSRQRTLDQFGQHGIASDRVEFVGAVPRPVYLERYHRIDIALDPAPYNGVTTTFDALWMGVPVVSLAGKIAGARAGLSILSTVGLSALAASSVEDFVRAAEQLASDRPGLAKLREELRPRMEASPLMDAPRFARNIEAAYRTMWQEWCARKQS